MLTFTHRGKHYEVNEDRLLGVEGDAIKRLAQMTYPEWLQGLHTCDVDAVRVLVLLGMRRAGESVQWGDLAQLEYTQVWYSLNLTRDRLRQAGVEDPDAWLAPLTAEPPAEEPVGEPVEAATNGKPPRPSAKRAAGKKRAVPIKAAASPPE